MADDRHDLERKRTMNTENGSHTIGTFYKFLSGVFGCAFAFNWVVRVYRDKPFTDLDLWLYALAAVVILLLLRPQFVDSIIRVIADKLPFFSYIRRKDEPK